MVPVHRTRIPGPIKELKAGVLNRIIGRARRAIGARRRAVHRVSLNINIITLSEGVGSQVPAVVGSEERSEFSQDGGVGAFVGGGAEERVVLFVEEDGEVDEQRHHGGGARDEEQAPEAAQVQPRRTHVRAGGRRVAVLAQPFLLYLVHLLTFRHI